MNKITSEETKVLREFNLTEKEYLAKRQAYIWEQKIADWEGQFALGADDLKIARSLAVTPETIISGKIEQVARHICFN